MGLVLYWDEYKSQKMGVKGKEASLALNEEFQEKESVLF